MATFISRNVFLIEYDSACSGCLSRMTQFLPFSCPPSWSYFCFVMTAKVLWSQFGRPLHAELLLFGADCQGFVISVRSSPRHLRTWTWVETTVGRESLPASFVFDVCLSIDVRQRRSSETFVRDVRPRRSPETFVRDVRLRCS